MLKVGALASEREESRNHRVLTHLLVREETASQKSGETGTQN